MDKRTITALIMVLMTVSALALPNPVLKRSFANKRHLSNDIKEETLVARAPCEDSHINCFYMGFFEDVCSMGHEAENCRKTCGLC
ncbi:hypothetical protein AC249_AIPGENE9714 [Exaiptasia diaphana]|nr:hypothetical protein AC249_AIPGENE9714 [Exaiptasia diaphana]